MKNIRILSLCLILSILLPIQTSLVNTYCNVQNDTTPQILSKGSRLPTLRSSTQYVLQTQTIQIAEQSFSLKYIQDLGNLSIQSIDSTLTITKFTDDIPNKLIFIDAKNQYIVAKQITNQQKGDFNYVILTAPLLLSPQSPNTSTNLNKLTISSILNTYKLNRIIEIQQTQKQNIMYLLFINGLNQEKKGIIYKINLLLKDEQATIVSQMSSANKIDIIAGNLNYLYDKQLNQFYERNKNNNTGVVRYFVKSMSSLGLNSILNVDTIKFVQLYKHTIVYSYVNEQMNFFPLSSTSDFLLGNIKPISLKGKINGFKIINDNWRNMVAISDSDLIWIKISKLGSVSSIKLSQISTLNSTQKQTFRNLFFTNNYISFNKDFSFVLSKDASLSELSFNHFVQIQIDTVKEPYLSKVSQILVDEQQLSELGVKNGNFDYKAQIACNCISSTVQKLLCDSSNYKCFAITSQNSVDCTKTI